jgi:hypothetical protein
MVPITSAARRQVWGHDTTAAILHGRAVLQHQKKRGGNAEDDQLRDPKVFQRDVTMSPQARCARAQNEQHQRVKTQQHRIQRLARDGADDVADEENTETDQQH